MPTMTLRLNEAELKDALKQWATRKGYRAESVSLALDRPEHPTPTDYGEGFSASIEVVQMTDMEKRENHV